jgi:hypothetical protein
MGKYFGSTTGRAASLMAIISCFLMSGSVFAGTYYIAANGSDTNNGTSTSTPWLHAPGMPKCTGSCAAHTPAAGDQFIFRGGDTWHFGNSSATPYAGGTWSWAWSGTSADCDVTDSGGAQTSCIYVGVDKTWYSGASWTRPVLTGDNPTSTSAVTSCAYGPVGAQDVFFTTTAVFVILDNFEFTGMCQSVAYSTSNGYGYGRDKYVVEGANSSQITQNLYRNNYFHGWTHLPFSCSEPSGEPVGMCYSISAFQAPGDMSTLEANVIDGWDSDPRGGGAIQGGPAFYVFDNVFANQSQIEMGGCHDWHDNRWFNYYPTGDGISHGNQHECNTDAPGEDYNGHSQTGVTTNVFYNNVLGHNAPGNATAGDVKLWFCVTTIPEYWFGNILYDQGTANFWDIDTHDYNCSTAGKQYMFNNTVDAPGPGAINCVSSLTAVGNQLIVDGGSAFASGSCTTSGNTSMTHATAASQGYMATGTGTSGNDSNTTCANDLTPCAPTLASNSTVGAGANGQSYCTTLLGSSDPLIVMAGNACKNATTDACSYNASSHAMMCPAQAANARPLSAAWDAGAYQWAGGNTLQPPTNVRGAAH